MELEIERMNRLLDPGQRIGLERFKILHGLGPIERAVAVDREAHPAREHPEHGFDAFDVVDELRAADLDLEAAVALTDGALHVVPQPRDVVYVAVVAAAGVDRNPTGSDAAPL